MERVCKFLKDAGTYYLATVEGDQPRVRPFGTAHIFEGKLYIQTGKIKPVSKQLMAKPLPPEMPDMLLPDSRSSFLRLWLYCCCPGFPAHRKS